MQKEKERERKKSKLASKSSRPFENQEKTKSGSKDIKNPIEKVLFFKFDRLIK